MKWGPIGLSVCLFAASGCGGETETAGLTSFRGMNLASGAGVVRFATDTGDIGDAAVGISTSYVSVRAGVQDVYATRLGVSESIGRTVSGEENARTTLALIGNVGAAAFPLSLRAYSDTTTLPDAGTTSIRVLHASTRAPAAIDMYVVEEDGDVTKAEPVFKDLAYGFMSDYRIIPVGGKGLRIRITAAGTKAPLSSDLTGISPGSGAVRTVVCADDGSGIRATLTSN